MKKLLTKQLEPSLLILPQAALLKFAEVRIKKASLPSYSKVILINSLFMNLCCFYSQVPPAHVCSS